MGIASFEGVYKFISLEHSSKELSVLVKKYWACNPVCWSGWRENLSRENISRRVIFVSEFINTWQELFPRARSPFHVDNKNICITFSSIEILMKVWIVQKLWKRFCVRSFTTENGRDFFRFSIRDPSVESIEKFQQFRNVEIPKWKGIFDVLPPCEFQYDQK